MIPKVIKGLASFPTTISGKVDRNQLLQLINERLIKKKG